MSALADTSLHPALAGVSGSKYKAAAGFEPASLKAASAMGKGLSHVFSECFYHLNFHCKHDYPMITPELEPLLLEQIEDHCRRLKGVHLQAIGATSDHLHMAFQLEPFFLVAEFIKLIKGSSSFELNAKFGRKLLQWQRGYGLVTFSKNFLPGVKKYVLNQKQHHHEGTINETLEQHGDIQEEDEKDEREE